MGGPSCFATYYDIATVISEGATLATSHGNIVGIAPNHAVFNIIKGTTVTLTATHNGCTTTTVLPASICGGCVIPELAAIPSQTICQGDTLEPVGSSITNGVSARLQWFNDNGAANPTTDSLSGQNTPILTALPTTPGVYKYKLVATNTTDASCVGTQTVTITINETPAAPTISFAASRRVVCPDSSVTLTAGGCATTVNWHYTRANGSTGTLAATETSVTVAYNTIAGTPTDSLTFRATCAGTCAATLYSNALLVVKKALCDTATVVSDSACYVSIKATDAQGQETTSLPRLGGTLQPLKLQADDLDSSGFWNTGVTYLWTRPDSTTTTTDTLVASTIGAYKLLVSKQGRTCEAYVTLNAKPCVVRDYTSASCQTVTITNPTATNQLSSLAPGDVFYAADYSIHVTEASGGAGGWSGKGYVEVLLPLGVTSTVAVTFSGIAINDCYELTNGTVETEYDPTAGGILDIDDAWKTAKELVALTETRIENAQAQIDKILELNKNFTANKQQILDELAKLKPTIDSLLANDCRSQAFKDSILQEYNEMVAYANARNARLSATMTDDPLKKYLISWGKRLFEPVLMCVVDAANIPELIHLIVEETEYKKTVARINAAGITGDTKCFLLFAEAYIHEFLGNMDALAIKEFIINDGKKSIEKSKDVLDHYFLGNCSYTSITGASGFYNCLLNEPLVIKPILEGVQVSQQVIHDIYTAVEEASHFDCFPQNGNTTNTKAPYIQGQIAGFIIAAILEEIATGGAASPWLVGRKLPRYRVTLRGLKVDEEVWSKVSLKGEAYRKWLQTKSQADLKEFVKNFIYRGRDMTIYADKFIQSPSQIQQRILGNLNNNKDSGKKMSATTAQKLQNDGVTITDLDNKIVSDEVRPIHPKNDPTAGDRDLATPKYLIECKTNLSTQSFSKIKDQIDKMVGVPDTETGPLRRFMNPTHKKVIIYTEETLAGKNSVFLKQIQDYAKEWDVLIIDNYADLLKTLKK